VWRTGAGAAAALVCEAASEEWTPLMGLRAAASPPAPAMAATPSGGDEGLHRMLAVFLGWTGAHYFYKGDVRRGLNRLMIVGIAMLTAAVAGEAGRGAAAIILVSLAAMSIRETAEGAKPEAGGEGPREKTPEEERAARRNRLVLLLLLLLVALVAAAGAWLAPPE